ncbi:MAG TPA: alkene reductase [Paraburkholderia sp.]|jgi:NADPH2 dehydrogenase/N-ethylmaleimide reductase|uniref:alkene reductase n=1 Tax=Paraburkholderia sp. TaxID=1926495 RepID=UPI002B45CDFA|nr:alkene reductase [Paraburkholderia sp.]HKR40205.1 alkene reductase [Paraburkholderia sp.]
MHESLFEPVRLGAIDLANRIVMAPMTRNRADPGGVPTVIMADYYSERAEAGLIVAEGTWPIANGQAYCRQPGLQTLAHIAGWSRVVDAVHARGGKIVLQVMHAGRIGSKYIKPPGVLTVAPSPLRAAGQVYTDRAGMQPYDEPMELDTDAVRRIVNEHRLVAIRAREAGFDGVELHGTSGYLPMQFMCTGTNLRRDEYGGSLANRIRFAVECLSGMAEGMGADRVGLRLNPGNTYNDTSDDDSVQTHVALMEKAAELGLAWLHVMRSSDPGIDAFALARRHFGERLILNDSIGAAEGARLIDEGAASAVSFARDFIGNPDLVRRLREGLPLAKFDRKTLYTAGSVGYSDYPAAPACVA